jgi:hypothetical protein
VDCALIRILTKTIEFEWPEIATKVSADLLDDEPELCELLWKTLEQPLKLFCRHPVSTGCEFGAEPRPPKHPVKTGTQAQPLGRKKWLLSKVAPGSITYGIFGGYGGISIFYGPCTEPLPTRGPVVAKVDQKNMDVLVRAGKYVWNAQYLTHTPVIMFARRKM